MSAVIPAIEVSHLRKTYGPTVAVDDVSFAVAEGEILDTPAGLAERAGGGKRVRFVPSGSFDDRLLTGRPEVTSVVRQGPHVLVSGSGQLVNAVILTLAGAGVSANDVQMEAANLEDAFVRLTGRSLHGEHHEYEVREAEAVARL